MDTPSGTDDPAALLEHIRAELRTSGANYADTSRLLKAVEAVLALHQSVTTNGGWLEGREWQECGECGPNNGQENVYAAPGAAEEFWPCPTVRAITTALAGEAGDDGQ